MAARKKETCLNGHPRTPDNVSKSGNCKICMADRVKAYRVDNPCKYNERRKNWYKAVRIELRESYLNHLVHVKTGLPASQITDEDRAERKRIVEEYRAKKQRRINGEDNSCSGHHLLRGGRGAGSAPVTEDTDMAWPKKESTTTKHTHQMSFGRRVEGCPRCEELKNGAAPIEGWGARAKRLEDERCKAIREHDCKKSGCGPVCTFADW